MTLREYILRWQEICDKNQSRPTTYAAHGYLFKNHILPGLGDIPLSELTVESFWRSESTSAVIVRKVQNIQGWANTPCGTSTVCFSSVWTRQCGKA